MNKNFRRWFFFIVALLIIIDLILLWNNHDVFSTYKDVPKFSQLEVCSLIIVENNQEQISKCDLHFSDSTNIIVFRGKIEKYNEVSPPIVYIFKNENKDSFFFKEMNISSDLSHFFINIPLPEKNKKGLYRIIIYSDRQIVGSLEFSIN